MARLAATCIGLTLLAACGSERSLRLPEGLRGELAFAVLYEGAAVAEVGEVVPIGRLLAGRYVVSGDRGLEPRLAVLELEALLRSVGEACDALPEVTARIACRQASEGCGADPLACLIAVETRQGCGERVELGAALPLAVYGPGAGDVLALDPGGLPGVALCGPVIDAPCPSRVAGYALSQDGLFRCTIATRQRACSLQLDLSGCGLPEASASIDEAGVVAGTTGPCRIEPLASGDHTLAGGAGFALVCGAERYVATYMEAVLGEVRCPRRGPPAFDTSNTGAGVITGFTPLRARGWAPRYAFTGFGRDECATSGCANQGRSCPDACREDCEIEFLIPDCAQNDWAACSGLSRRTECGRRCERWCGRGGGDCYRDAVGLMVAIAPPASPELDRQRVPLERSSDGPALGRQALAPLGVGDGALLVASTRARLHTLRATAAEDNLALLDSADLTFDAAGVITGPWADDGLLAFGRSRDGVRGFLARARVGAADGTITVLDELFVDDLPCADLAAAAGASLSSTAIYLGCSAPRPGAERDAQRLVAWPTNGGALRAPHPLPGRPSALASLPGGGLAVAVAGEGGAQILIYEASGDRLELARALPVFRGMRVTALLTDPGACTRWAGCLLYAGLEQTQLSGNALVGAVSFPEESARSARLLPALVETGSQELSLLADDADGRILAIAARKNVVTLIERPR